MVAKWFDCKHEVAPLTGRPLCTIVVDAEEDFDWSNPVRGDDFSVENMRNIEDFQEIAKSYGAVPTYLLTFPVLEQFEITDALRRLAQKGECEVGIQLHTWVTPPYSDVVEPDLRLSFAGNLPEGHESFKMERLITSFIKCFDAPPKVYRAGRYGLSRNTPQILRSFGVDVDTSVAPVTDLTPIGGPDFSEMSSQPFWFGIPPQILEIPLCRDVVGRLGNAAPPIYRAAGSIPVVGQLLTAVLSKFRLAERITLSPEGNDVAAMLRLVQGLLNRHQKVLSISFHSSSLKPGRNPYVRSKSELHEFFDNLSALLAFLTDVISVDFVSLSELHFRLKECNANASN